MHGDIQALTQPVSVRKMWMVLFAGSSGTAQAHLQFTKHCLGELFFVATRHKATTTTQTYNNIESVVSVNDYVY